MFKIYKNINLNKYLQLAKTNFPRTNREKLIVLRQMETLCIRRWFTKKIIKSK